MPRNGVPRRDHFLQRRPDDRLQAGLLQLRRKIRHRRVGAHAAGVRPGIAIADPLVVLRRTQQQRVLAIAQGEQRDFLAHQAFLDHHRRARFAEHLLVHHGVDRRQRLVLGAGDHDALARRQPVGLHHDRRAAAADECPGRVGILEPLPQRGRNAGGVGDFLGEGLAALQLSRRSRRTAAGDAGRLHRIGNAGDQRRFRPGHHQIDRVVLRESRPASGYPARRYPRIPPPPAMPGLPGAQYSLVSSGLPEMAQHSACSRPPDPTTSTFIDSLHVHGSMPERGPVMPIEQSSGPLPDGLA